MKRKGGPDGGDGPNLVRVSKEMSRILRHAPPPGAMDSAGFVSVPALLKAMRVKTTEDVLRRVVAENDKKRFVLDDAAQPPRIRAAQGHSVELDAPVLTPVTDAATVPVAVHVTGKDGWKAIQDSGELRRMKRTHIHFATSPGMLRRNNWACVYLRLQLQEALAAGHEFGLSSNGVLLTEGPLPVALVSECQLTDLPEGWAEALKLKGDTRVKRHEGHASAVAAADDDAGPSQEAAAAAAGAAAAGAGGAAQPQQEQASTADGESVNAAVAAAAAAALSEPAAGIGAEHESEPDSQGKQHVQGQAGGDAAPS